MMEIDYTGGARRGFWLQALPWLAVAAMLVPLVIYIWGGKYMRYSGDDYCYGSELAKRGFIQNQAYSYLNPIDYNGNRYSLTLFSNLGDLIGTLSPVILPGLAIAAWLAGIFLLIRNAFALFKGRLAPWMGAMAACFLVFLCLYQAPMILQALYWRTSMLTYLAPVVSLTWLLTLGLMTVRSQCRLTLPVIGLALLAVVSAGFSETGAALQIGVLGLVLLPVLFLKWAKPELRKRALVVDLAMLTATLVALALLALSPSNAARYGNYPHPDLGTLILMSFRNGFTFIYESLRGYPLPSAIGLGFFAALGLNIGLPANTGHWRLRRWFLLAGGILLAIGLLVALTAAPSALARGTYPEPRAWMPGRAVMTAGLSGLGVVLGMLLKSQLGKMRRIPLLALACMVVAACVYGLHAVSYIRSVIQPLQTWSQAWDARDRDLRSAIASGGQDLTVPALEMVIPWVSELQPDPGNWYNLCAAGWYGANSITAVEQP